jgi:hypothetical protein
VLWFERLPVIESGERVWRNDCTRKGRAEQAKSDDGGTEIMANAAKPVKKSNKLGAGKKLEKKQTLLVPFKPLTRI